MKRTGHRPSPPPALELLRRLEAGCPFQPADFTPDTPPHQAACAAQRRWLRNFILDLARHVARHPRPR